MLVEEIFINKLNINIKYLIGKNASDNFNIIDFSLPNDLWFHLYNYPSCHIIASIDNLILNKKELMYIIKQGCLLCKKYSKYNNLKNLEIIYTSIKNIQKTKVLGTVISSNTKSIFI